MEKFILNEFDGNWVGKSEELKYITVETQKVYRVILKAIGPDHICIKEFWDEKKAHDYAAKIAKLLNGDDLNVQSKPNRMD